MIAAGISATIASTVSALGSTLEETWSDKLAAMLRRVRAGLCLLAFVNRLNSGPLQVPGRA